MRRRIHIRTWLALLVVGFYSYRANFKPTKYEMSDGVKWEEHGYPLIYGSTQERESSKTGIWRHPITRDFYYQSPTHLYNIRPKAVLIDFLVAASFLIAAGVATELLLRYLRGPDSTTNANTTNVA